MSGVYQVVAPLVLVKDEYDRVNYAYEGAIVRLSDEQASHFLEESLVVESEVEFDDEPADEPGDVSKPGKRAGKPALIAWLVENAAHDDGTDFTAEELDAEDKDALWAKIDTVE